MGRKWGRGERGQSLVEMALVSFLLILLVIGVIDFGRAFNSYVVINNASREGARAASRLAPANMDADTLAQFKQNILQAVKQETTGSSVELQDQDIDIDPDPEDGAIGSGSPLTVTVSYTVPTIIADMAGFGYLPLRARTSMIMFTGEDSP